MKHLAVYLLLKLGGNDSPTADDVSKALSSVGVEADSESLDKLISEMDGKDINEVLESGNAKLAKFGGGGGGGGGGSGGGGGGDGDAAEEEKEEEEEEEADIGGGVDMFGGDDGGGY